MFGNNISRRWVNDVSKSHSASSNVSLETSIYLCTTDNLKPAVLITAYYIENWLCIKVVRDA
jgi:hypothetical protein